MKWELVTVQLLQFSIGLQLR